MSLQVLRINCFLYLLETREAQDRLATDVLCVSFVRVLHFLINLFEKIWYFVINTSTLTVEKSRVTFRSSSICFDDTKYYTDRLISSRCINWVFLMTSGILVGAAAGDDLNWLLWLSYLHFQKVRKSHIEFRQVQREGSNYETLQIELEWAYRV